MTRRYYRGEARDRAIDDHLTGKKDHGTLLWTLLNLEIRHRIFARGRSTSSNGVGPACVA